eukprot:m.56088 g.56088  ORF g.56088 m.56088 type:complete len:1036 (+) comp15560_c1_seq5:246-3353(+)
MVSEELRFVNTALLVWCLQAAFVSGQTNCSCGSGTFERRGCDTDYVAQCSLLTQCVPKYEYETAAPTSTTDRHCSPCRVCDGVTVYRSQLCTLRDDTACSPIASCGTNEFELYPGGETHDRACAECKRCAAFEYQTAACTQSSDTVCERTAVCLPGFYESSAPTSTSNRECRTCNACDGPDEYILTSCTAHQNSVCGSKSACSQLPVPQRPTFLGETVAMFASAAALTRTSDDGRRFGDPSAATGNAAVEVRIARALSATMTVDFSSLRMRNTLFTAIIGTSGSCNASASVPGGAATNESFIVSCDATGSCTGEHHVASTVLVASASNDTLEGASAVVSMYTMVLYDPDSTAAPPTRIFCASLAVTTVPPTTAVPVGPEACYQACSAGEFINITTGLCTECNACEAGFYSRGGCVNDTDTVCVPHTDCSDVQVGRTRSRHQLRPGNATHDAECVDCAVCSPIEFESAACTVSSDTVCQTRATCTEGSTYEVSFGNQTVDRDCRLCNPCLGSEYTARSCSTGADTSCVTARTTCAQGEFGSATRTLTSDIVCDTCTVCQQASGVVAPLVSCTAGQDTVCPTTTSTVTTVTATTVMPTVSNGSTVLGAALEDDDNNSSVGVILGVVLGVLLCAVLAFLLWRRKQKAVAESQVQMVEEASGGTWWLNNNALKGVNVAENPVFEGEPEETSEEELAEMAREQRAREAEEAARRAEEARQSEDARLLSQKISEDQVRQTAAANEERLRTAAERQQAALELIDANEEEAARAARDAIVVKAQMAEEVTSTEKEVLKVINARKRASMKRAKTDEEKRRLAAEAYEKQKKAEAERDRRLAEIDAMMEEDEEEERQAEIAKRASEEKERKRQEEQLVSEKRRKARAEREAELADLAASRLLERQQREQAKELHEQALRAAGQYVACTGLPTCMCYDCVMDREEERVKTQQHKEALATLAVENELEHAAALPDDWEDQVPPENVDDDAATEGLYIEVVAADEVSAPPDQQELLSFAPTAVPAGEEAFGFPPGMGFSDSESSDDSD